MKQICPNPHSTSLERLFDLKPLACTIDGGRLKSLPYLTLLRMDAKLAKAFRRMEHWRLYMQELVAAYPREQQCFRPHSQQWSMLQVMKHLIIAETVVLNAVKKSLQRGELPPNRLIHKIGYLVMEIVLRLPLKIKAPAKALIPDAETDYDKIVGEWEALRKEWKLLLENFPKELQNNNVFRHPIAGFLNICQCVNFCGTHIKHHLQQIDRIGQALKEKIR